MDEREGALGDFGPAPRPPAALRPRVQASLRAIRRRRQATAAGVSAIVVAACLGWPRRDAPAPQGIAALPPPAVEAKPQTPLAPGLLSAEFTADYLVLQRPVKRPNIKLYELVPLNRPVAARRGPSGHIPKDMKGAS